MDFALLRLQGGTNDVKLIESVMDPADVKAIKFYKDRVAFHLMDGGYIEIRIADEETLEIYTATEV